MPENIPDTIPEAAERLVEHTRHHLHRHAGLGEQAASRMAAAIGSWRFLIIQSVLLTAWLLLNGLTPLAFDRPPFILLNLMLSFQAAFTGPILLIAANRQSRIAEARDSLEAQEVDELHAMNKTQLEILHFLKEHYHEED